MYTPGTLLLRWHNRQSKYDPFVEEIELLDANPEYAHVKFENGRESTISLLDLVPYSKTFDHAFISLQTNYRVIIEMWKWITKLLYISEVNNEHS